MHKASFYKGMSCGMISTICWGTFYPVSRVLFGFDSDTLEPLNFTFLRFALALLILLPVILLNRDNRQALVRLGKEDCLSAICLGSIGILGEGLLVFWSLKYTTSARASLMANASPITTLIISYFAGREALTKSKVSGMLIGFLGLILAFTGKGGDMFAQDASMFLGDLLAFLSGVCWATYTVFGDRLSQKYGGMVCTAAFFVVALVLMLPVTLVVNHGIQVHLSWQAWLGAFYLGAVSYGLANSLWYVALKYVTPGQLGSLGYVSAMLAFTLSIVFLGEKASLQFLCAIACVMFGVWLMLRK